MRSNSPLNLRTTAVCCLFLVIATSQAQATESPAPHPRGFGLSFAPIQGLITNGGGVTLSPLVIEAGIFVLRSSRTNLYAGAGVTLAPLIGLAGALGGKIGSINASTGAVYG